MANTMLLQLDTSVNSPCGSFCWYKRTRSQPKVEPGPGGSIFMGWAPEIQGASEMQAWEPGRG